MQVLRDGVLVAGSDARGPQTVVELRCPQGSEAALRRLLTVAVARTGPDSLTVSVPVEHGDALLTGAIAAGCSVLAVRREPAR